MEPLAPLAPIPPPRFAQHEGVWVLRDDDVEGGSKLRVAPGLLDGAEEWVFAGPAQGYAQLALAIACRMRGKRATFFCAQRREPHPLTARAMRHGLRVVFVPAGRISVVQARARAYCEQTGARFAELGLLLPGMAEALYELAVELRPLCPAEPREWWVAAGSGTLASSIARAFPEAQVNAVQVGMTPHLAAGVRLHKAPEGFADPARGPLPPFPSALAYDAKVWRFVRAYARRDGSAFVWNVGA